MFEFLFKYPASDFAAGTVISPLPAWQWLLLPLAAALAVFLLFGTFRLRGRARLADRAALALLRGLALGVIAFSLSQPLLELTTRSSQPGLVGVLVDDSLSMRLPGTDGGTRAERVREQLDAAGGNLLADLRHRFDLRLFGFGADARPIVGVDALEFAAGDSDLSRALGSAREALEGEPLAGLVVLTDGALTPDTALDASLLALRSAGIPVYPVGIGAPAYARDIEIARVRLPEAVMSGSRILAEVSIRQQGYSGETVELLVEDDSRILHKQPLELRDELQTFRIPLSTGEAGARRLEFRIAPREGEQIAANNRREAALAVDDRRMRILYFEGEPRFEMKFVRRAVADDENLGVTGLIRTADAKFYRVGIESRDELRDGFPSTRAELFTYDALILGSVEISLLSRAQQQMIVDFVSARGGGLLLLGGRHAFTEGGYRNSVLHALSPVIMPDLPQPEFSRNARILPTDAAWVHPALALADSAEDSVARWLTLPKLDIVNPIRELKPGATLLLGAATDEDAEPFVAMAWHRYGRGKVVAFPVQNSWLWQMHHEIELEDQSHERLWRQLLRWLVERVPQRLDLELTTHRLSTDGTLRLRAEVLDADYTPLGDGQPRAVITAPDGLEREIPLAPHPTLAGIYEAGLPVNTAGEYRARVELDTADDTLQSAETRFSASPEGDEYFHSELNASLLQRIADETGGRYFGAADLDRLPDALDDNLQGARTLQRRELWDMPLLFLLLVALLSAEWAWRRWRGLP